MFARPTEIPAAAQALPGREEAMRFDPVHKVLGSSMVEPFPEDCEQVVFGLGCFWGAERRFWTLPGVFTTAVGYAAGHTPNPTYQEIIAGMDDNLCRCAPTFVSFRRLKPRPKS